MNLNKPTPFNPRKDHVDEDWRVWKKEFLIYLRLSDGYTRFSEEQRALLLVNLMGTEAIKAMDRIIFEQADDKKDMHILLEKFDAFFNPPLNEIEERFKFFSRGKALKENLDKYILDMKEQAAKCNFGNDSDKFIVDMFILNTDEYFRDLIWASNIQTLPEIIHNYKQYNIRQEKMLELSKSTKQHLSSNNSKNAKSNDNEQFYKHIPSNYTCSKCGIHHPYKQCPAFNVTCQKCSFRGHYTRYCKQMKSPIKETNRSKGDQSDVREVSSNEQSKPSTSNLKQNIERDSAINTLLLNCTWCNSCHMPGKCPHNSTCIACNNFPHNICFHCKKNPHEINCIFKQPLTLASNVPTNNPQDNIPHTASIITYNKCPTKTEPLNNVEQRTFINNVADDFLKIESASCTRAQPQSRELSDQQYYHEKYTNSSRKNRNKDMKSDPCCIS